MFISFEGIDGSGKSTQLQLLFQRITEQGNEVLTLREPGATRLSEQIREVLLSTRSTIDPIAELFLFSSARAQLVREIIKPALANGVTVLIDRYFDSTTAYQGFGREIHREFINDCNQIAVENVLPAVTFLIDIPIELFSERRSKGERDRMEDGGVDFFERVRKGYLQIAKENSDRFVVIDGTQPIGFIHDFIWETYLERLKTL